MIAYDRAFFKSSRMRWLVGYYGVFQAGHIVLNLVHLGGLRPIRNFPPPPAGGWHPQATAFWTSMALIDTAAALLALYFVAAFFRGRRRALWAGLVALTTNLYAALSFNYTVIATGAWALHPVEYVALNAVSIPLGVLFALVVSAIREAAGAAGEGMTSSR